MAAHSFDDLIQHEGHNIVCITYGAKNDPWNVAIECEDCGEVLLDFDRPTQRDPIDELDRHIEAITPFHSERGEI